MMRAKRLVRWLLPRLALALLAPAFLLTGAEMAMRLSGVGYPTSFLIPSQSDGAPAWASNPFYGYRFFPPLLARNPPQLLYARDKPDKLVRVVVLGESAALGDPVIPFSAPRILEKMLNYADTGPRFEVVNAAMTAINSAIIADIASELHRLQPDVVILYIGNNEVVGPYGPGAAFTGRGGQWITPLRVRLSRLHLAHALRIEQSRAEGARTGVRRFGMQLFDAKRVRADDPRLEPIYRLYENRMLRIIGLAQATGADVLLCTMAVNLSAGGPFGSSHSPDSDPALLREWRGHFDRGVRSQAEGRYEEAVEHYAAAARLDDTHAELLYRKAQTVSSLDRPDRAAALFSRARDWDTLRFRSDSRINHVIRGLAAQHPVTLVDVEQAFLTQDDDAGLFLDHVHFTFEGAYLLAGQWFDVLAERRPDRVKPPLDVCRERTFFTPWAAAHQAMVMYDRRAQLPFLEQLDNAERREALAAVVRRNNEAIHATDLEDLRALYEDNIARDPNDLFYHLQYATILMTIGRRREALEILKRNERYMAHHFESRILPAYLLARTGDAEQGAAMLVGDGPPYGWFLSDITAGVMNSLEKDGHDEEALRMGMAVLEQVEHFPGRDRLAARVERKRRALTDRDPE